MDGGVKLQGIGHHEDNPWELVMRDVVFLSHANPEDNVFARWLYSQLSREGYLVWCDHPMLIGGEDWWRDIETVLRSRTSKFIYVLSKKSNYKDGSLHELRLALSVLRTEKLHDFIIPVHIDELPYSDTNIELQTLIQVPFELNWATGLQQLLLKLERENVPKNPNITPSAVNSWWRTQFSAERGVANEPEEYLSNLYPIKSLPQSIFFHRLDKATPRPLPSVPFAFVEKNDYIVTFAPQADTDGLSNFIEESILFDTERFMYNESDNKKVPVWEARRLIVQLLNASWLTMAEQRALPLYQFSGNVRCFYFPKGMLDDDKIHFEGLTRRTYRKICGAFGDRHWHFGVRAKAVLYPEIAYSIKPHVLFSDDGKTIWESKERLHRTRRSACRNWWNEDWRDRVLATMSWLSNPEGQIILPMGEVSQLQVSNKPLYFRSIVSYRDPVKKHLEKPQEESDAVVFDVGDLTEESEN
jgi:hypothetical protein